MNTSMIFFIVRATNDCDFKQYVGRIMTSIAISQLVAFPLLAWITDFSSKHISAIFIISVFIELLIETMMIFETSWSLNEIVILHVIRQLGRTVNTNAMYKLLKIKLLFWLRAQYSNSMEQKYFQTICMTVITVQSIVNVLFWYIMWQLYADGISGEIIQNLILFSTLIFTLITQLFALLITAKYLRIIKPINLRLTAENIEFNTMHTTQKHKLVTLKDIENKLDTERMEMDSEYIRAGLSNIYYNKLCFESTLSAMYLMLFMTICEYVFPLFFATQNLRDIPNETIHNLCAGSIVVIIQYQVFGFILYFIGALIFLYFTKMIEPPLYFNTFIPIFCYISIAMLLPLYFYQLFDLLNKSIVIFFAVIPQFLVRYNLFYSTACVDQKFVGILLCIHTNLGTLTPLLSGLLLTLNIPIQIVLTVAVCFLLVTSLHSKHFYSKYLIHV